MSNFKNLKNINAIVKNYFNIFFNNLIYTNSEVKLKNKRDFLISEIYYII